MRSLSSRPTTKDVGDLEMLKVDFEFGPRLVQLLCSTCGELLHNGSGLLSESNNGCTALPPLLVLRLICSRFDLYLFSFVVQRKNKKEKEEKKNCLSGSVKKINWI